MKPPPSRKRLPKRGVKKSRRKQRQNRRRHRTSPKSRPKATTGAAARRGASEEGRMSSLVSGLDREHSRPRSSRPTRVNSVKAHPKKPSARLVRSSKKLQALEQRNQAMPSGGQVKLTS